MMAHVRAALWGALLALVFVAPAFAKRETIKGVAQVAVVDLLDGTTEYESGLWVHGKHRKLKFHGTRRTKVPPFAPGAVVEVEGEALEDGILDVTTGVVGAAPVLDPNRNRGPRRFAIVPAYTSANPLAFDLAAFTARLGTLTKPVLEGSAYGRMQATFDVHPPRAVASGLCDLPDVVELAMAGDCARDWSAYQFVQVLNSRNCDWVGLGSLGTWTVSACGRTYDLGVSIVTTGYGMDYTAGASAHELGHNFGLHHDGAYAGCGPANLNDLTVCTKIEYGGWTGSMSNSIGWGLFEPSQSQAAGWLDAGEVINVTASGTYALAPVGATTGVKMLSIPRAGMPNARMFVSFRSPQTPQDAGLEARVGNGARVFGGALAHLSDVMSPTGHKPLLVDATPNVPAGMVLAIDSTNDPRLLPGTTLVDAGTGTTVTLLAISDTAASVRVVLAGGTTTTSTLRPTTSTMLPTTTSTVRPTTTTAPPACVAGGTRPPSSCAECCSATCDRNEVCRLPEPLCAKPRQACAADWQCCKRRCGLNGKCRP